MRILNLEYFFFFLFLCPLASHADNNSDFLNLENWEISFDSGKTWSKTKPVPWEYGPKNGGPGVSHNGFAEYRIFFRVPPALKEKTLAFYADCIDDADEEFLNGHKVGKFGRFPDEKLRSAAREARLSLLPDKFLSDNTNEFRIRVYDIAGLGGFCYSQNPVIGDFFSLQKKELHHRLLNDLPRSIGLFMLFILIVRFTFIFQKNFPKSDKDEFLDSLIFPYKFLTGKSNYKSYTFRTQVSFRALLTILFCLAAILFLYNETTYKYALIDSEYFFFKIPTIGFVLGEAALIHIFYPDVFRVPDWAEYEPAERWIRKILSYCAHPFLAVALGFYLVFLPYEKVWDDFTLFGIALLFFIPLSLFIYTIADLFRVSSLVTKKKKSIRKEALLRLFVFLAILTGFLCWFYFRNFLLAYSFLIMIIFVQTYLWFGNKFLIESRIIMPVVPDTRLPIYNRLTQDFLLTHQEAKICELVYKGKTNNEIVSILNILPSTIKVHRKSIYAKTIDKSKTKKERSKLPIKQIELLQFLTDLQTGKQNGME